MQVKTIQFYSFICSQCSQLSIHINSAIPSTGFILHNYESATIRWHS